MNKDKNQICQQCQMIIGWDQFHPIAICKECPAHQYQLIGPSSLEMKCQKCGVEIEDHYLPKRTA